ncbi:hypothetical protein B9G55_14550 [Saccharibacillus sp. O16]|nr:hypothetical protein B9G55_14550 [Saccharibacillus sp. O16]
MKKLGCGMVLLGLALWLAACGRAEYEEIDLSKQIPVEGYEQYLRWEDGLLGLENGIIIPDVYEGRIGKKIGTVQAVGPQIVHESEVGSLGKEGLPVIQPGDEIHKIKGIDPKNSLLIQTKEGYVAAFFLRYLDKK